MQGNSSVIASTRHLGGFSLSNASFGRKGSRRLIGMPSEVSFPWCVSSFRSFPSCCRAWYSLGFQCSKPAPRCIQSRAISELYIYILYFNSELSFNDSHLSHLRRKRWKISDDLSRMLCFHDSKHEKKPTNNCNFWCCFFFKQFCVCTDDIWESSRILCKNTEMTGCRIFVQEQQFA